MFGSISAEMILAILPELLLVVFAVVLLLIDLFGKKERGDLLGWLSFFGFLVVITISLFFARPSGTESHSLWGGMIHYDLLGFIFKILFLVSATITCLFALKHDALGNRVEFYLLLITSTLGMSLMSSSSDIIMLFLAIECTSIPLYVMAGFLKQDEKSIESGFKYLLFGAMASAVMLYGFSLLFGFSGTTNIYVLADKVKTGAIGASVLLGTFIFIMVGFGFKISIVPFHFWTPDVYEGAPTPVAGFLSTASKAAGFAVVLRFLLIGLPMMEDQWVMPIAILSAITMTLGNAIAISQTNIKRLLAYSSIAHAGYILMGIATATRLGATSVLFYLIAYMLTNLAAFGVVVLYWSVTGTNEIAGYAGLSRRSPILGLVMLVAFLSLAGVPPMGGFIAKVLVFAAAVKAGLIWLAVIGVLNAIIGIYYYLIVLKVVYLYRSEQEDKPLPVPGSYALALSVCVLGILLIGTVFAPFYGLADLAVSGLF